MSEKKTNPWLTGELFDGHFEVGHLIARGGMAEVYHGVDLWSNNPVAIKVLAPHLSADPSQQQKFFREERSLRQISHQHVVGVVGSGTQRVQGLELMFIVLEYVHGGTLQQLLSARPVLSVRETFEIILPIVEGLSEVHAHRFIHRDIKPSNILLSSVEHSTKLTDFGLTRKTDQNWTGELMGTPAYVAPEIVTPQANVGPGVDIFALGIVMFRMLAGRLPFTGMSDDQQIIYHNVNTEVPSLTQFAPGVDADVVGVIKWCTRKQASARPADATELFEVLQTIRSRLSEAELEYRAQTSSPVETLLWDDVENIAERTGATRLLQQTSISGFGAVEDTIEETEFFEDDLDDSFYEAELYAPREILGVGPAPAPTMAENAVSPDETMQDSLYYDSISASYRHGSVTPERTPLSHLQESPVVQGSTRAPGNDERQAPERWQQTPATATIVLVFILVLLATVLVGYLGWLLAQNVSHSAWFASWTGFLDSISSLGF